MPVEEHEFPISHIREIIPWHWNCWICGGKHQNGHGNHCDECGKIIAEIELEKRKRLKKYVLVKRGFVVKDEM